MGGRWRKQCSPKKWESRDLPPHPNASEEAGGGGNLGKSVEVRRGISLRMRLQPLDYIIGVW